MEYDEEDQNQQRKDLF